jgi:hypothetical protein
MTTQKTIGPSFAGELLAAGLTNLPFSYSADGDFTYGPTLTADQIAAIEAVYAAHDPSKIPLSQQALSALAAGITISSTGTPTLDGTYACDQLSQMDIIAVETSISAGKGFPGGATTFNYPDVIGVMHSFTEANFTDFAAAVRDYVYALKSVIAGASTTLPAASTTIG